MQFLIPALIGALASAMGSLIGRLLLALGVGFVTYKGVDAGLDAMKVYVVSSFQALPAQVVGLVGFLWLDKGLTLIFSSFAVVLTLRLVGGSLKKAVLK